MTRIYWIQKILRPKPSTKVQKQFQFFSFSNQMLLKNIRPIFVFFNQTCTFVKIFLDKIYCDKGKIDRVDP